MPDIAAGLEPPSQEATAGKKLLLQPFDVALQEDILLVDERYGDIGDGLVASTTYPLSI